MKRSLVLALLLCSALSFARSKEKAHAFSLKQLDGGTFDLAPHLGKDVVIVSFFATNCAPCMAELPELQKLHEKFEKDGLLVVAVSIDEPKTAAAIKPFVREHGIAFTVLLDTKSDAVSLYDPKKVVPFTALIDRTGMIEQQRYGFEPGDDTLASAVQRLLSTK